MKVWLKVIVGEKLDKSYVLTVEQYKDNEIEEYVKEICNEIDEPTPIFLNKHFNHIKQFHNTHFTKNDFVEYINFDTMIVEVFDEKDKKHKNKLF